MKQLVLILPVIFIGFAAHANDMDHSHTSNYAGEQTRAIKSLSPDDIAELKRGGGWGLAKVAELNGVPGPTHLLEMKGEIALDAEQISEITNIFHLMREQAIEQGEKFIALEQTLESHFQNGSITDAILRKSLDDIAKARQDLRYIHLATHLKTPEILSADQIKAYNDLRGYSNTDPCANVPDGHNPEMWRQHNGCK